VAPYLVIPHNPQLNANVRVVNRGDRQMNNKDMPAMPVKVAAEGKANKPPKNFEGLTKLEYAAIHIAQGLLASGTYEGICNATEIAQTSKKMARYLF
jgi:hypothetical protein